MREHRQRTPEDKVRRLQERLHLSAKLDKQWRQKRGMGYSQYPTARLYEEFGLHRLPTRRPVAPAHA